VAASADKPSRRSVTRQAATVIVLSLVLLTSCTFRKVLVVSDPYIENLDGTSWGPGSKLFALRAGLAGFHVTNTQASQENDLTAVLMASEPVEFVIISPWNAASLKILPAGEQKLIIAGAPPAENTDLPLRSVVPDRSAVFADFGVLTAGIVQRSKKKALAIFNASTESKRRELIIFTEAFRDASDGSSNPELLIIRDLSENDSMELPADFGELSAEASILLLFAGPLNLQALAASADSSVPVITESLRGSGAWKERIVASVEENTKGMNRALIAELRAEIPEELRYYPATLIKGVLYSAQSR
jgi:hypothetical protein